MGASRLTLLRSAGATLPQPPSVLSGGLAAGGMRAGAMLALLARIARLSRWGPFQWLGVVFGAHLRHVVLFAAEGTDDPRAAAVERQGAHGVGTVFGQLRDPADQERQRDFPQRG